QAADGIPGRTGTGVHACALPISRDSPSRDSALHGVAWAGRTCVAVGDGESRAGNDLTFAEVWNGTRSRLVITPNPDSAEDSFLRSEERRVGKDWRSRWRPRDGDE